MSGHFSNELLQSSQHNWELFHMGELMWNQTDLNERLTGMVEQHTYSLFSLQVLWYHLHTNQYSFKFKWMGEMLEICQNLQKTSPGLQCYFFPQFPLLLKT